MSRTTPTDARAFDAEQVASLTNSIVWIGALAIVFGGTEVVTAIVVRDLRLLVAGVATASVALGARLARARASRGEVTGASLVLASNLLALCLVATLALPFAYSVLLITSLMAVTLVLPYVRGRPLYLLLWSAAGTSAAIVVVGACFKRSLVPSWWVEALCDVAGGIAGAALVLRLLGHFSDRLWRTVEQRQDSEQRMRLLAEASALLGESLAYQDTLARVAQMAVPALADWCVVTILGPNGQVERAVGAHADRSRQAELEALLHPSLDAERSALLRAALRQPGSRADANAPLAEAWLKMVVSERGEPPRRLVGGTLWVVPLEVRGDVLGVLTLAREDTAHPLSLETRLLAEELARRAALAIDNARLFQAQQQLARTREEFLTVAAHELRTPLTSLELLLSAIVRDAETGRGAPAPSATLDRVRRAERQVRKLTELVHQLLDLSRLDRGRLELKRGPVDLAGLVREVLARLRPTLEGAGCELRLSLEEGVVGSWDAGRLDQVVTNLLGNAVRYAAGKPITVVVERIEDGARLTVRDEGIGIARLDQERIFQPFERAASIHHYGGLGLGLWISRGIVQEHGGSIRVTSSLGTGAAFVVELPLGSAAHEGLTPQGFEPRA